MSFTIINSIRVQDKEVFVTISNEFENYFNDLLELNTFQSIENINEFSMSKKEMKDLVMITIESELINSETSFATNKNQVTLLIDNFVKILEKREDYELCALFTKAKLEYNNYLNEEQGICK